MSSRPTKALVTLALTWLLPAAWAAAERGSSVLQGQAPPAGHYDAVLCVSVGAAPASCGPVRTDIGAAGQALVRVSDIAYRLEVYADQLGVTVFHGTMQIDGFFARYQWVGTVLQFQDPDKSTRYELKIGARRFDTP
jgi:hypothetical protein